MTLRTRILGLAGLLAFLFLSLITYTLYFFSTASGELNLIVQRNLAVEKTAETLNSTILTIRSDIWNTMVFDRQHRKEQVDRLDQQAKEFYQGLRDLAGKDPSLSQTAQDLRFLFQGYYQFGSTILDIATLEEFVRQTSVVEKFRQNQVALTDRLSQTLAASKEQFFGAMDRLNANFSATTWQAFVLAACVTLASFLVAILLAGRLTGPLERLTRTARQVSDGNYTIRPEQTSSGGEIHDLTDTFITMLDQIEAYSTRMEDIVRARTDALVRTNAVMVKELKLAQKIQGALIPQVFPTGGQLALAGAYLPMEDLGGDFYDVFEVAPGVWTLVMADVSGHGVPAALVTTMVKISLGLHGPHTSTPGEVLDEVNREICAVIGDLRRYVTMLLCTIDLNKGTLKFCNAGHNELVVMRRDGRLETFGPNSGVVGLRPDELFVTRTLPFEPGDGLFLFTDGLVEARGPNRDVFTLERVLALLEEFPTQAPSLLVERLSAQILEFSHGIPRQDDIAFLAVRWAEGKAGVWSPAPVTASDKATPLAPWHKAEELFRAKEFQTLLTWTEESLKAEHLPPDASRLWHWRAMAFHHLGLLDKAIEAWDRALTVHPDHHRARRNRDLLIRHIEESGHGV